MAFAPDNLRLLYITDPMCAWCYGFTPVLRRLMALWQGRLSVEVLVGGLHPFATEPLTKKEKERLAVSWHQVQERTQLPFDYSFFLHPNYVYDTEPACRTLLAVQHLRPVLTLEILRALHSAFYADGQDLTNINVLIRIAEMFGIPENLFLTLYESEEIMRQTRDQFDYVQQHLGINNFPTLLIDLPHGKEELVRGYCDLNELEERLLEHLQPH